MGPWAGHRQGHGWAASLGGLGAQELHRLLWAPGGSVGGAPPSPAPGRVPHRGVRLAPVALFDVSGSRDLAPAPGKHARHGLVCPRPGPALSLRPGRRLLLRRNRCDRGCFTANVLRGVQGGGRSREPGLPSPGPRLALSPRLWAAGGRASPGRSRHGSAGQAVPRGRPALLVGAAARLPGAPPVLGLSRDRQPLHLGCFLSRNIGFSHRDRWESVTQREAGSLQATLPSKRRDCSRPRVPGTLGSKQWAGPVWVDCPRGRRHGKGPGERAAAPAAPDGPRVLGRGPSSFLTPPCFSE